MIELLGFWFVVSVIIILLTASSLFLLVPLSTLLLEPIEDEKDRDAVFNFMWGWGHSVADRLEEFSDELFFVIFILCSVIGYLVIPFLTLAAVFSNEISSGAYISFVADISEYVAPYAGWLVIGVLSSVVYFYVVRYGHRLVKSIFRLKEKLDAHVSNKEIHKQ